MSQENPTIATIRARRSVRRYRHQPVARELLETIVDCGRLAPTSNNRQTWEFIVVTDADTLRRIAELATYGKFIADAAACIVVCGDPGNSSVYLDGAAATENMLLAIHSLGLASCWVQTFEKEYAAPIKAMLGVPEQMVLVSMVPVAHSAGAVRTPTKRPLTEVLHWDRY
jgi:nitroreductase